MTFNTRPASLAPFYGRQTAWGFELFARFRPRPCGKRDDVLLETATLCRSPGPNVRVQARMGIKSVDVERTGTRPAHARDPRRHTGNTDAACTRMVVQQPSNYVERNVPFDEIAANLRRMTAGRRLR